MPASQLSTDTIDRQVLRDLEELGGGLDFVADLADGFIKDTELLFDQLKQSIAERALRQFRDLSHAIRGSAGSVGARRLHELGGRACRISDRDFSQIAPMAESEMCLAFTETKDALENYLNERRKQVSRN
jgi:two-component system sensor histidine kinase RpfC